MPVDVLLLYRKTAEEYGNFLERYAPGLQNAFLQLEKLIPGLRLDAGQMERDKDGLYRDFVTNLPANNFPIQHGEPRHSPASEGMCEDDKNLMGLTFRVRSDKIEVGETASSLDGTLTPINHPIREGLNALKSEDRVSIAIEILLDEVHYHGVEVSKTARAQLPAAQPK